jgi:hypothetical protein
MVNFENFSFEKEISFKKREFVAKYMICYKYFSQNGEKSPQIYGFGAGVNHLLVLLVIYYTEVNIIFLFK